ncbi:MAG: hypothetical protein M1819_005691 [Sarea resinae]|nr:MAG: hypothetical protein M1819_005691 [Sarea resinae]
MALLYDASPEFQQLDLENLIRSHPITTAFELLKIAGEGDERSRVKIYRSIQLLATLGVRRPSQSKGAMKKSLMLGLFFEQHVLGIMALISDKIDDVVGLQPTLHKKICLKAIEELIKLAKSHISNALPQVSNFLLSCVFDCRLHYQICASLQSALENKELRDQALSTWATMVTNLEEVDLESLVDSTFAIVVQYWDSFGPVAQERAYAMIAHLLKEYPTLVRDVVHTIPSLASIPLMSKFEAELARLKSSTDLSHQYEAFIDRCKNENMTVVFRALTELEQFLQEHQSFLQDSAVNEQPNPVVAGVLRSVLDACVKFKEGRPDFAILCAKCIGLIGCLDPNRVEAVRDKRDILVLSNFERADETVDFVLFFLQDILVKAFLSATNSKQQGFLSYGMQELLKFCGLDDTVTFRTRDTQSNTNYRRWIALPEPIRNTLTPFLSSRYVVAAIASPDECTYPIYDTKMSHGSWLRKLVIDLLQKSNGDNAGMIFSVCSRVIRWQDISIANFLLPFAALNVVVGGTEKQLDEVVTELLAVLSQQLQNGSHIEMENLKLCSESVFQVLDYFSRWMQEKKKQMTTSRNIRGTTGRLPSELQIEADVAQIQSIERVLSRIPAEVISRRAVDCKSYARALFHWEQYIRQEREKQRRPDEPLDPLFERLQDIYTQIDEPDGIEGISTHLHVLNIDQQILEHRKAGRWTAAQSWYEMRLAERPDDIETQVNLLTCLKESGQHDVLLNQVEGIRRSQSVAPRLLSFAVEASWATGKWSILERFLAETSWKSAGDFNIGIGHALLALHRKTFDQFYTILGQLRTDVTQNLSDAATSSFQACHDAMLRCHVLTDIESIGCAFTSDQDDLQPLLKSLDRRLNVLGAFLSDKQYLLGLRRAAMELSKPKFTSHNIASSWLRSAKLARKGNLTHEAFNAVLHASQLGDQSATIEHSRLLWKEGHHRKAIQSLDGAIAANAFSSHNFVALDSATVSLVGDKQQQQNYLTARAHLLLAKWLDAAGQTPSSVLIGKYQEAARSWEKGHYYLGKHYNKLLDLSGEYTKLVIENYLRAMSFGTKNIFQILPRVITLWLDMGSKVDFAISLKEKDRDKNDYSRSESIQVARAKFLEVVNKTIEKYIDRLTAYQFYTALSQLVARICHVHPKVNELLTKIIVKVVSAHPQQALWTLLAVVKSSSRDRASRGVACLNRIKDSHRKRAEAGSFDFRALLNQGQKISDQLLHVCERHIESRVSNVSLSKDLGFNHKNAPCPLVIPLEATLTASLPASSETSIRNHRPFVRETVTISAFLDDVLVLSSLQKPRKLSVRGSDGRLYGLLCKPKDDLRKDQRLMEFNAMINRSLKRDAESSKRRLYIKTYAVTPLNEECGLIEWIDNLKTLRDILLKLYKQKNVAINYGEIRMLLDEACSHESKLPIFTRKIIPSFPPVFHEWFVEMFPEAGAWFAARLRYTRSCAVMSMVGHVLGLGDRHGENILFEEGNGGTFHVDFNCLFDKGLTFEKPELVPFRLTHNMVDAFGVYGYEGPFRKSCELTMTILRQNEDTLMTILETFLYDPTTDFIGKKVGPNAYPKVGFSTDISMKKRSVARVPETPQGVLDSVRSKLRGLLADEAVPLSEEGHVQALIQQATSPRNLAAMYIGWCAFF